VGGDPAEFGFPPARFHRASAHRAKRWRHTMLATSTHDNKRSEDVRLRIDVISEKVGEFRLALARWRRMNAARKVEVDGTPAPSANDEYLLYQTLLGSFPAGSPTRAELGDYRERIVAYMGKAIREAKRRTSWANVNAPYEAATEAFVRALLDDHHENVFLADLRAAVEPIAWVGLLNGLSMTAIKLTSPGVPDIYQGTEVWDLSLVDPDNRRPVDYARRRRMLAELEAMGAPDDAALAAMLANLQDGRAKLFDIWRLLQLRRERPALFRDGGYTALRVVGARARHLIAFARRHGGETVVTVAPRLIAGLGVGPGEIPGGATWGDTRVELPMLREGTLLRDAITGQETTVAGGGVAAAAAPRALSGRGGEGLSRMEASFPLGPRHRAPRQHRLE
jgi:(1->4)-alpha-D-glucan 1-alpha-D-glucosylmutase